MQIGVYCPVVMSKLIFNERLRCDSRPGASEATSSCRWHFFRCSPIEDYQDDVIGSRLLELAFKIAEVDRIHRRQALRSQEMTSRGSHNMEFGQITAVLTDIITIQEGVGCEDLSGTQSVLGSD